MKSLFLLRSTVYVRIRPDWLSVLHVESGAAHADVPTLALANTGGKHAVTAEGGCVECPETLK